MQEMPATRPRMAPPARSALLVALAALAVGAVGGFAAGQRRPVMHETPARCSSGEMVILCQPVDGDGTIDSDEWSYSVPLDVAWTGGGAFHERGRPDCLQPSGREASEVVRLTWVEARADGKTWREVVSVGC